MDNEEFVLSQIQNSFTQEFLDLEFTLGSKASYRVVAIHSNGVKVYSEWKSISSDLLVSIYPNPSSNIIHVQTPSTETYTITLMDENGKTILSQFSENNGHESIIDISHISSGLYVMELVSKKERIIKRLVKI